MLTESDAVYSVPVSLISNGEFSYSPKYGTDAVVDYVTGVRLINDGVAIIDRTSLRTGQTDGMFLQLTRAAITCNNPNKAREFATRIEGSEQKFDAYISLADSSSDETQFLEDLERAKMISKSLSLHSRRIDSLTRIAEVEIKHGLDPKISLDAAKLAVWSVLRGPNYDPAETNLLIDTAIKSCIRLAAIEKQLGQDPVNTLSYATISVERITYDYQEQANLYLDIAELIISNNGHATDELAKAKVAMSKLSWPDNNLYWRSALLESGENVLPRERYPREIVISRPPEPLVRIEDDASQDTQPVENHRTRLANNLLMARMETAMAGDPVPYFDSAKDEVLLKMIKNNKTEQEYTDIAVAEVTAGLKMIARSYPLVCRLSSSNYSRIFDQALSRGDTFLIASLGTILPIGVQDSWLGILPEEEREIVQNLFYIGRAWIS